MTPRIALGQSQLHREYMDMLAAVADEGETLRLQASWARRGWCKWIANIFSDLESRESLAKLDLLAATDDTDMVATKQADADLFLGLTVRTASQRAWMMLSLHDLPPANWKGVFHPQKEESLAAWKQIREDALCVQKAFDASAAPDHPEREVGQRKKIC